MRYYIGIIVSLGLLILALFLLFHGNSKVIVPTTSQPLNTYASTNSEVRLTIDGPINANVLHDQVQITVDQYLVTYDQIRGYNGDVVNQQQFPNSQNAYTAFLYALELNGFTDGSTASSLSNEQGHCALGDRYTLELINNGNELEHFWSTSCPNVIRSYYGNMSLMLDLFEAQVPNYQKLAGGLNI